MAWLSVLWGVLLCVVDSLQHAQPPSVTILCPLIRRSNNPVLNAAAELDEGAAGVCVASLIRTLSASLGMLMMGRNGRTP
jgi:hypothetical protein